MKIERIPISKINPASYNPRKDLKPGDREYEKLKRSIQKFDIVEPLVWNKRTGNLVGGHQRLKILKNELGMTEAEVSVVDLDEKSEKALNVALNKISGDWDIRALKELLVDLDDGSFDLTLTGFDEKELKELIDFEGAGATNGEDEVPEPPKVARTKRGDLYVMGQHRLLCGDSTDPHAVADLMAGLKAGLMNTDPPYGIAYVATAKSKGQAAEFGDIDNDDLDGEKLQAFLEAAIRSAVPHLTENSAFYLWHPMLTQGIFFAAAAAAAADILIHRQIIWVKPSLVFGRGDYHWQHELCFYGWRRGARPDFLGERNQTTIWNIGRENDGIHPTQKPVALFEIPILNHLRPGDVSFEPFAGSGSQFIAAEKTGRRCFGMEIEPKYCDVIVERWEKFSGKKAVRSTIQEAVGA